MRIGAGGGSIDVVKAVLTDPRVIGTETDHPAYWVIFWARASGSEEWRITDALSVHEVLVWAEMKAGDRTFQVFAEARGGPETHVLRLTGTDPTRSPD